MNTGPDMYECKLYIHQSMHGQLCSSQNIIYSKLLCLMPGYLQMRSELKLKGIYS